MSQWPEMVKEYRWLLTGLATLIAAIWTLYTFKKKVDGEGREAALKRFEKFLSIRNDFRSDEIITNVRKQILGEPNVVATYVEKIRFMDFVEQIALMVQSNLMSEDIAFYIFGFEFVEAYNRKEFWTEDILGARESGYWRLYRHFSERMVAYQKRYPREEFPVDTFRF